MSLSIEVLQDNSALLPGRDIFPEYLVKCAMAAIYLALMSEVTIRTRQWVDYSGYLSEQ
ncbi:hypothetical protein V1956_19860 [Yersinia sp. 2540 StPb PI]|uniref:hypothetical protein n=1 Tax=Yersinia sp. 2540 StPb PI TaxID=3117406 RepID=UPI003FA42351